MSLPFVTKILARGAKPHGDFGLVYQRLPTDRSGSNPAAGGLYQPLPPRRRTTHRPRLIGTHNPQWRWWAMVYTVEHSGEPYTHSRRVRTVAQWPGRYRKEKIFFIRPVGIAFNEHGGKTGRAMIKYPLYKKNAQPYKRALYPGLTTVSLDRIINLCRTTMF